MKNRFKQIFIFISLFSIYYSLFPTVAYAVCPVCTVAVGAGLGLSRWLGIDDAISSIWIGGLILSMSFWMIDWLKRRKFKAIQQFNTSTISVFVIIAMYTLTLIPLWLSKVIGNPLNTIIGIDKVIFGTIVGSIMFLVGMWADKKVRKIKGRQLFQYQKVVFPVLSLVLTSLLIYYYGGYLY